MKVLWTLLKIVIALALVIPISIIVLGTALGILGALLGVAILALKIAVFGLVGWGVFRLVRRLVRGPRSDEQRNTIPEPRQLDPHYEAAMRELDRELDQVPR
jgi:hypothetical protein